MEYNFKVCVMNIFRIGFQIRQKITKFSPVVTIKNKPIVQLLLIAKFPGDPTNWWMIGSSRTQWICFRRQILKAQQKVYAIITKWTVEITLAGCTACDSSRKSSGVSTSRNFIPELQADFISPVIRQQGLWRVRTLICLHGREFSE